VALVEARRNLNVARMIRMLASKSAPATSDAVCSIVSSDEFLRILGVGYRYAK
jgi:hypothetical protein